MRWRGMRTSGNVEDRRGMRAGGGGMAIGGGGLLLIVVFALLTGQDPLALLDAVGGPSASVESAQQQGELGAPQDELGQFAATVLGSTEDVWAQQFSARRRTYEPPRLVLFSSAVQSACGFNSAAVGPFYCPPDHRVYIDLSFFDQLERRFGAPGDFAQAYVIAHEVGHHVQNLLGIAGEVHAQRQRLGGEDANALSVRMELQADCLAGVWAHHANREANLLEPGDIEEGLTAAAAIGDDQIQKRSQGYTVPESWTHGSSAMRARWLKRGLESGDAQQCDTFAARDLG
ncbi:MAG TPA: neutral zinc metallopeptidase [Terriglobales bacterium]|nr:neutral zinc metallopeptidase [Terriglobales bacterium]